MNDLQLALQLRDQGIQAVSLRNADFLATMRGVARMICRQKGEVTADDLREWADRNNVKPSHVNAFGAIFRSKEFVAVGEYISRQKQGHGNKCYRWGLRT